MKQPQLARRGALDVGSTPSVAAEPSSEGDIASTVGTSLIWFSLIAATICIFAYGRIEVPDDLGGTRQMLNPLLILTFVAAGLNGAFFGYLLAKVGSVLRHLEAMRRSVQVDG